MASRGFESIAFHGFSHTMFARDVWYPKIGFTELNFFEDMVSETAATCRRDAAVSLRGYATQRSVISCSRG